MTDAPALLPGYFAAAGRRWRGALVIDKQIPNKYNLVWSFRGGKTFMP
jgi:hypothetical protein